MSARPEVIAPASAGAFLTCAPWLAEAAGAGAAYGFCGAAAAAVGVGAVPFALETREMPTAVASAGVAGAGWGSWTAWVCWSNAPTLSGMAIGAFLTIASAAAGAVIGWRREGTPIERAKLDLERVKLDLAETRRDMVTGSGGAVAVEEPTLWAEIPGSTWEEPARVPGTTDPIDVGNGIVLPLVGGHIIVGGTTGAGKSVFVADTIADLLPREHMRITAIDPKGDPLLGMLRNSDVVMGNCANAEELMTGHRATMVRRGGMVEDAADAYTRGDGPLPTPMWVPTEKEPWEVIVVDEFTDFAGTEVMECIVELARKSRSLGQTLILLTQSLEAGLFRTESSTSGGGPRSQFATRIAGRLDNESESDKVFGPKQGKVWQAHMMPGKGHLLVRSEDQREPVMRRAPYMDMATLAAWAQKCAGRSRIDHDPVDEGVEQPYVPHQRTGSDVRHLALVKPVPSTQGEVVMDYLTTNGSSSASSIAGGTGVPRGSLGKVLQRLADDGCVVKADGLWKPL